MNSLLFRIKEIIADFIGNLIRISEKSPALEEAPARPPSELKVLAEMPKGTLKKTRKILKLFTTWERCI